MLVTLKEILALAEEKKMAVGAFNAANLEGMQAILEAAQELRLPVILQFAQTHESWNPLSVMGPVMVNEAKKAIVPVCVHLDHGSDLEYLRQALEIGFTGIMYDGSTLPYGENLRNTRTAVAMAAPYGASVEAELGSMGRRESGAGEGDTGEDDDTKIYTDPGKAREFVRDSGIDALACSFGTTHGLYLSKPKLDVTVVQDVRRLTNGIPVVMHGGSGVSAEEFRRTIAAGVRKINYFTYMDKAGGTAAAQYLSGLTPDTPVFFSSVSEAARKGMKENVMTAMKIFAGMD